MPLFHTIFGRSIQFPIVALKILRLIKDPYK
jgi:hypothetical protein